MPLTSFLGFMVLRCPALLWLLQLVKQYRCSLLLLLQLKHLLLNVELDLLGY
jgi:hypothetical protein